MQINKFMLIQKKSNDILLLINKISLSITSLFIYNAMFLAISYSPFGHFCSMMMCVQLLVLDVKWIMLITNSSLVIPHNLIHKYKHALVIKGFKFFGKIKTKQHTNLFLFLKNWKN
jgi:hypothetical protein